MVQADGATSSVADKQKRSDESLAALQRLVNKLQKEAVRCEDPERRAKLNAQAKQLGSLNAQLRSPLAEQVRTVNRSVEQLKQLQNASGGTLNANDFELNERGELQLVHPKMRKQDGATNLSSQQAGSSAAPQKPKRKSRALEDVTSASSTLPDDVPPPQTLSKTPQPDDAPPAATPVPLPAVAVAVAAVEMEPRRRDPRVRLTELAAGRETRQVRLTRRPGEPLGFSITRYQQSLTPTVTQLGVFVHDIVPGSVADTEGALRDGEQILAINGTLLDEEESDAVRLLTNVEVIEMVVASGSLSNGAEYGGAHHSRERSNVSAELAGTSTNDKDSTAKSALETLNTEWSQLEVIDLVNDGSGLGFGIIGGRSLGVVVRTVLPGGAAHRDGRLRSGDHILQITNVVVLGMTAEQVAAVLRKCGSNVMLIVARPVVDPLSVTQTELPIVPTARLEEHLRMLNELLESGQDWHARPQAQPQPVASAAATATAGANLQVAPETALNSELQRRFGSQSSAELSAIEYFEANLTKDSLGLGITIGGYVIDDPANNIKMDGIFVKSVTPGSAAERDGRIRVHDQIVEVDGVSLEGYSNHQAVEVMRQTGASVRLRFARHLSGPIFDQLQLYAESQRQEALLAVQAVEEVAKQAEVAMLDEDADLEKARTLSEPPKVTTAERLGSKPRSGSLDNTLDADYGEPLTPEAEAAIRAVWQPILGSNFDIIVAQINKASALSGLGISLEGTIDVENGQEVRPHHYIRSILPDGPVGQCGVLRRGDELIEVNGKRLLGLTHVNVIRILKELPSAVRLVCARAREPEYIAVPSPSHVARVGAGVAAATDDDVILSRHTAPAPPPLSPRSREKLIKAKSDLELAHQRAASRDDSSASSVASLAVTAKATASGPQQAAAALSTVAEPTLGEQPTKSQSLEPLNQLAMWSTDPVLIELPKGERGLGFSILDYKDPVNTQRTVIVVRSLVPGGVAHQDGRLMPGDRIVFVNDVALENASLDQAVAALKGAPRGIVRIGIAKPLPVIDTTNQHQHLAEAKPAVLPQLNKQSDSDSLESKGSRRSDALENNKPGADTSASNVEQVVAHMVRVTPTAANANANANANAQSSSLASKPQPATIRMDSTLSASSTDSVKGSIKTFGKDLPPIPSSLEQTIRLRKGNETLGVTLDAIDAGINGSVVRALLPGGTFESDGRIGVNDFVTCINNESLRSLTNAQVRAILKRTSLLSNTQITVNFIPNGDAQVYRETAVLMAQERQNAEEQKAAELARARMSPS